MGKTQTPNYNLTKDDQNEFYDILMHAQNMDLIDGALKGLSDNKVTKVEGKGLSTNDYTTSEKQKLAEIQEGATNYQHPQTHSLDIITETTLRKIFSSTERTKLANIEENATADMTPTEILDSIKTVDGAGSGLDAASIHGYDGAYILGRNHGANTIDPNIALAPYIMTNHSNSPGGGAYWHIRTQFYSNITEEANRAQIAIQYNSGISAYVRNYFIGTWTEWKKITNDTEGIATTIEAQEGTANNKTMTPLTVKEAIHMLAVSSVSPGEVLAFKHPVNDTYFNSSSYYKKRAWMQVGIGGTYRVSFDMKVKSASDILYGRIYVNGIARGTVRQTTSTSFITYTEDITIDHGDTVELWFKNTPIYQCEWGNFELKVNYPFPTLIDYDFDHLEG